MACPACKRKMDGAPVYTEDTRRFQHFICDTVACPVGSLRIEWREGARRCPTRPRYGTR